MTKKGLKNIFILIVINILITIAHYMDNIIYLDEYPDPEWMKAYMTDAFWFLMTPFSIIGYNLLKKGKITFGAICLYIYSLMSLFVLAHYLISPIWEISFKINFLILLETFSAIVLIIYLSYLVISKNNEHPIL